MEIKIDFDWFALKVINEDIAGLLFMKFIIDKAWTIFLTWGCFKSSYHWFETVSGGKGWKDKGFKFFERVVDKSFYIQSIKVRVWNSWWH